MELATRRICIAGGIPCKALASALREQLSLTIIPGVSLDRMDTLDNCLEVLVNQINLERQHRISGYIAESSVVSITSRAFYLKTEDTWDSWRQIWKTGWDYFNETPSTLQIYVDNAGFESRTNEAAWIRMFLDVYSELFGFRALAVKGPVDHQVETILEWIKKNPERLPYTARSRRTQQTTSRTASLPMNIIRQT